MKKELIILAAALALAGCNQQGGTGDDATVDTGSGSASATISTNESGVSVRGSAGGSGSASGSGSISGSITNDTSTNKTEAPKAPEAGNSSNPQ